MNTALAIVAHALRMLVFETATTLRVLMPALLLVMVCSIIVAFMAPDMVTMIQNPDTQISVPAPSGAAILFIFGFIGLLGYALMAILWHRHVLLNGAEHTEILMPTRSVFLGYIWRAIVVGFVQMLAAIPITLIIGVVGAAFILDNPGGLIAAALGFIVSLIFVWIALRFSVVLPAAALGQAMPVRESWSLTSTVATELWGVAALLTGLNILVYAVTSLVLLDAGPIAIIGQTGIFIVEGLVFISVLTTLYGHLVEGRSLGQ